MRLGSRRGVVTVGLGVVLLLVLAPGSAAAHIAGGGSSPTNYRSVITDISPAAPGVQLTLGLGGQWVRVSAAGARRVTVLGYRGEPFLRLAPGGVQLNRASPTAARTRLAAAAPEPAPAGGGPRWVQVSRASGVTWSDARLDGSRTATGRWRLGLVVDERPVTVAGLRERVAPPAAWPWLALAGVVAAGAATLAWLRRWPGPVAATTAAAGLVYTAHLVGAALAVQRAGPVTGWVAAGVVAAVCLITAGLAVFGLARRRVWAPFAVVVTAAILGLTAFSDISVLWNSQLAFVGPEALDRGLVAAAVGGAAGLLIAGLRQLPQSVPEA